jgi:hypothetical protein
MAQLTKGLLPLVGTVAVASLLLGVVGLYHSRYAALKTGEHYLSAHHIVRDVYPPRIIFTPTRSLSSQKTFEFA